MHSGGQEFDPPRLHQFPPDEAEADLKTFDRIVKPWRQGLTVRLDTGFPRKALTSLREMKTTCLECASGCIPLVFGPETGMIVQVKYTNQAHREMRRCIARCTMSDPQRIGREKWLLVQRVAGCEPDPA